jgi:hypothetical protein
MTQEKVYQGVLMHPVDLSEESPNPIALHTTLGARAWRKSHLQGHIVPECIPLDDAIQHPNAAYRDGPYVIAGLVEERPDEAPSFQAVRWGKGKAALLAARGGIRHSEPSHGLAGVLVTYRELFTSLLAAALNDLSTFFCFHPLEKAVLLLALLLAGLVGTLRHNSGVSIREETILE